MRFTVNLYTRSTYSRFSGYPNSFPENTYHYDKEEDVTKCISDLLKNDISGIYLTEIIDERF